VFVGVRLADDVGDPGAVTAAVVGFSRVGVAVSAAPLGIGGGPAVGVAGTTAVACGTTDWLDGAGVAGAIAGPGALAVGGGTGTAGATVGVGTMEVAVGSARVGITPGALVAVSADAGAPP
jgi:hypothetical protein